MFGYLVEVTDVVSGYKGAGTFESYNEEEAIESAKLYYADTFNTYNKNDIYIESVIKTY